MKKSLLSMLLGMMMLGAAAQSINGDVNGDGVVNISDVNRVISIILTGGYDSSADVNSDSQVNITDLNVIIGIILNPTVEPPVEEHEWVDLGLPSGTLWATCNVGATAPEEFGDYFAWGETEPKDYYDTDTYQWYRSGYYDESFNLHEGGYTKYCTDHGFDGLTDGKTELEPEDDAATVNWGAEARMPSLDQIQELINSCTWKSTTRNGVKGNLVTGPNGNTIFLPGAGYRWDKTLDYVGSSGYYWSRTLCSYYSVDAYYLDFLTYPAERYWNNTYRRYGLSVRAVRTTEDDVYIEPKNLDLGGTLIGETCTGQLTIFNCTKEDITLTVTADAPFLFKLEEGTYSSTTVVVPGKSFAHQTVMFTATTAGEFKGNVTVKSPALVGGQQIIPVQAQAFSTDFLLQDYVDLGLPSGTLWATRDVGADSPEQEGDRFVWGETKPKRNYNKLCNVSENSLTQDFTSNDYLTVDNSYELEPENDAAYVNWGRSWRMPSLTQIQELINSCTCTKVVWNGVMVRLVTGPNGKNMLLPADGTYWSRTADSYNYAYGMSLDGSNWTWTWDYCWSPRSNSNLVRAVRLSAADDPSLYIEQRSLDMGNVLLGETHTGELTIVNNTAVAQTLTVTADQPFSLNQEEGGAASMTVSVPCNSSGKLTVMFTATEAGTFTGNVTFKNPAFEGGKIAIPVQVRAYSNDGTEHEWVDLGLPSGTLWATCNVGASAPEEYGDYFAWGETEPKDYYDLDTYQWYRSGYYDESFNLHEGGYTKYCNDHGFDGLIDGKTEL